MIIYKRQREEKMANKQYKTHTYKILNNDAGLEKLIEIRRKIDDRQNNTTLELFNLLLSIAGLFNMGLGFASAVFGGAVNGNASYLEYLEDMYTTIYEDFNKPSMSGIISNVVITQRFVGQDSGGERGVIWKAERPTYKYGNPIISH